MGTIIDLHIHTMPGSIDSDLSPKRLGERAKELGLTGVAVTEHANPWKPEDVVRFREEYGLFVVNAREWNTDMGHIGVFGLPPEVRGITRARDLHAACREYNAFMILCHPFRYFPGPSNYLFGKRRDAHDLSPAELAEHPFFSLVNAIEVLNRGCIERENKVAQAVAQHLGLPQTAGSDAHSSREVGRYVTIFDRDLKDEEDLLAELWAGQFRPGWRSESGQYVALEEPVQG